MKQVIKVWNAADYGSLEDAHTDGAVIIHSIPDWVTYDCREGAARNALDSYILAFREGMFTAQSKIGTGADLSFLACNQLAEYVVEAECLEWVKYSVTVKASSKEAAETLVKQEGITSVEGFTFEDVVGNELESSQRSVKVVGVRYDDE